MTAYKSFIGGTDIQWWAGVGRTFTRKTSTGGQLSLNRVGSLVDVLEVYGSGTAYTDSSISTALGRIGSSSVGLLLQPGTWTISNDLTIPANTPLYLMPGAVLSVRPAKTLTINSQPEAGRYQIFAVVEDTEAGTIGEFSFASGLHLKSSWFASLTSATTIIDSDAVTLEITKAETVSADTTVAATTTLLWLSKNILTISAAKTLTINGYIDAGLYQIFAATGTVTLGGLVKEVPPEWWGAAGDGTTDDATEIQAAIDSLGTAGGEVRLARNRRYLVDSANITIKAGVCLKGYHTEPGSNPYDGSLITSMGSQIILNSTYTLAQKQSSAIEGIVITRKGLVIPAADASAFAGTAITPVDSSHTDATVRDCFILGFEYAISATNTVRLNIERVRGDNTNGILINTCSDISRIDNIHFWPFVTHSHATPTNARTGVGIELRNQNDWTKVTNAFSWGYATGFKLNGSAAGTNSVILQNCGADNDSDPAGSIGYHITGSVTEALISGCQVADYETAVKIDSTVSTLAVTIIGLDSWHNTTHISLVDGAALILGCNIRQESTSTGVLVAAAYADQATISSCWFRTLSVGINMNSVAKVKLSNNQFPNTTTPVTNPAIPAVASAGTITLPDYSDTINITGTTNITSVTASWPQRRVTLIFAGVLTFTDGSNLKLAGNLVTTADDTITLVSDGTNWIEVARSAN